MKNLVKYASMGPTREALSHGAKIKKEDMKPVTIQDFEKALPEVRSSVSPNELGKYETWELIAIKHVGCKFRVIGISLVKNFSSTILFYFITYHNLSSLCVETRDSSHLAASEPYRFKC